MSYEAQNITVLEGLEAVRKRPGMYIGTTSERGLHHLVWEIVDNSVDEALAGYCDKIEVKILPENIIEVVDNGRGIPTDIHPKYGKSALEIVLTVLHAGGKFENDNYKVSGGLHGVGVSVVNALSEWLEVEVRKNGTVHYQKYRRGKPEEDVKIIGTCDENEHGTIVRFKADTEIFETLIYNYFTLSNRLKELAYLNRGLTIILSDLRKDEKKEEIYKFDGGILDFLNEIVKEDTTIIEKPFYVSSEQDNVGVDVTFTYTTSQNEVIYSFVNNINTHEGGTHVQGFRTALTKVINDVGKAQGLLKDKDGKLMGNDIREGVVGIVSTKIPQPQFEGQTKGKLGNSEVSGIVNTIVSNSLKIFLEDNPNITKIIIEKILNSKKAREAAQKARELVLRKSVLEVGSLPGKLADCTSKKAEECEIFIVEGDSAGGSAKQGRDSKFQAVLPLKGKIMNVEKARIDKILGYEEIKSMITAFGTGIGKDFNLYNLRYGKIVIMTDADVDGAHIRTLILTFFYRYMKELIEQGHVYIAQPPLYGIIKGVKVVKYCWTDEELQASLDELGRDSHRIQRYKGLGEMNPAQLWETTMNPENRLFLQVNIDDEELVSIDETFSTLMGDKVEPRREFIEQNAKYVENIDA